MYFYLCFFPLFYCGKLLEINQSNNKSKTTSSERTVFWVLIIILEEHKNLCANWHHFAVGRKIFLNTIFRSSLMGRWCFFILISDKGTAEYVQMFLLGSDWTLVLNRKYPILFLIFIPTFFVFSLATSQPRFTMVKPQVPFAMTSCWGRSIVCDANVKYQKWNTLWPTTFLCLFFSVKYV